MTFCSIITANYYAYAKILYESMLRYNKDFEFFLLIIDWDQSLGDKIDNYFKILSPDDVVTDQQVLTQMLFRYTAFEMANALKPFLLLYLLERLNRRNAIYLDTDIFVLDNLSIVNDYFLKGDILITPHSSSPLPNDDLIPNDYFILKSGSYNAGFIGVSRTSNGISFLNWWKDHLEKQCFLYKYGIFVDQSWLTLAVVYFDNVHVIRHPGFNVSYWNLHERNLSYDSVIGKYSVNSHPLLFVHLSGLDFHNPKGISTHQNRYYLDEVPVFKSIVEQYLMEVEKWSSYIEPDYQYRYDFFPSAKRIEPEMRWYFHENIERFSSYTPFSKEFEKKFLDDYERPSLYKRIRKCLSFRKE